MRTTYIVSIQIHSGHGPAGRINIWRRAAPNTGHNRPKSKINKKINLVWGLAFSDSPCYVFFSFRVPTRGKKKKKQQPNTFHPLFQFIMLVHLASRISHTAGVIYIYIHSRTLSIGLFLPTPPQRHTKTTRSHKSLFIFIWFFFALEHDQLLDTDTPTQRGHAGGKLPQKCTANSFQR